MGGGGKIPYPPHVWSPSGGWYGQPKNWRTNTAVMAVVIAGFTAMAWKASASLEERSRMPDADRVFPSRNWTRQIIEFEKTKREEASE